MKPMLQLAAQGRAVCLGLNPSIEQGSFLAGVSTASAQNYTKHLRARIEATHTLVCAYMLNPWCFFPFGAEGFYALHNAMDFIRSIDPKITIILDGQFGSDDFPVGVATMQEWFLDHSNVDAVTVSRHCQKAQLTPFIERKGLGLLFTLTEDTTHKHPASLALRLGKVRGNIGCRMLDCSREDILDFRNYAADEGYCDMPLVIQGDYGVNTIDAGAHLEMASWYSNHHTVVCVQIANIADGTLESHIRTLNQQANHHPPDGTIEAQAARFNLSATPASN